MEIIGKERQINFGNWNFQMHGKYELQRNHKHEHFCKIFSGCELHWLASTEFLPSPIKNLSLKGLTKSTRSRMQERCVLWQTNTCALTILKVLSEWAASSCTTALSKGWEKVMSLSHIFSSSNHNYREAVACYTNLSSRLKLKNVTYTIER